MRRCSEVLTVLAIVYESPYRCIHNITVRHHSSVFFDIVNHYRVTRLTLSHRLYLLILKEVQLVFVFGARSEVFFVLYLRLELVIHFDFRPLLLFLPIRIQPLAVFVEFFTRV